MPNADYPSSYIRKGFLYWLYDVLTFNSLKEVRFGAINIEIDFGNRSKVITNQSINFVSTQSGIFSKTQIHTENSIYDIRGLTKIDAKLLQNKIVTSRELSWKQLLSSHRIDLALTGNWVNSINRGIFFARNSIFPKNLKNVKL